MCRVTFRLGDEFETRTDRWDQGSTRPLLFLAFFTPSLPRRLCSSSERRRFKGGAIVKAPLNVAKKPKIDYCSKYQPYSKENGMATIWTMTLIYIVLVSRKRLPTTVIPQDRWPGYSKFIDPSFLFCLCFGRPFSRVPSLKNWFDMYIIVPLFDDFNFKSNK